jgi:hypothetical protein
MSLSLPGFGDWCGKIGQNLSPFPWSRYRETRTPPDDPLQAYVRASRGGTPMPELQTIYDYMRLCGAPHKRIYVKMLFMLSSFMEAPLFQGCCFLMAT